MKRGKGKEGEREEERRERAKDKNSRVNAGTTDWRKIAKKGSGKKGEREMARRGGIKRVKWEQRLNIRAGSKKNNGNNRRPNR